MGSEKVKLPEKQELQGFMIDLLNDIKALEIMLEKDIFEKDPIRIGAEQELCLVDQNWKPAMINMDVLSRLKDPMFTTELARFNMEINVEPQLFKGHCLSKIENRITDLLKEARKEALAVGADIILIGILPTIRKADLIMDNLTPIERYYALMESIAKLRGREELQLIIRGIDELMTKHYSPLPEACNTGFQVHLQVTPEDFANKYNIAQAIAGPALAIATNSPMLFGKRLWHETRVALFQQSIDVRTAGDNLRDRSARVMFGNKWVERSILEIYKEDAIRFRALLSNTEKENSLEKLKKGEIPSLHALQIHNSTVYRWNRPCYGISNGIPHLRIENRVLPSGPTVADEMANAAFWLGLMNGMDDVYPNISKKFEFHNAKANFVTACRNGMNTKFQWIKNKSYYASELILKEFLPITRLGLEKAQVAKEDIDRYLDILEARVSTGQSGSQWMLNSYAKLIKDTSAEEARAAITASIVKQQNVDNPQPVHNWRLASVNDLEGWQPSELIVEDFMQTELFTVTKDDIIQLVSEMMDWQKLRYVPVEDDNDEFIGLVTSRLIMRELKKRYYSDSNNEVNKNNKLITVAEVMLTNPITIEPERSISEAISLMQSHEIGCLPVVSNGKLLGIVTEQDYMKVIGRLTYKHFKV